MKRTAVGLLVILTLMTGCIVSQSTHEQTLQDLQATKSDLDRMRVQNEALNRQVKVLQEAKTKLRDDLDRASGELGALSASAGKDRQAVDSKLKDLERQVKDLTASKRMVAQELEVQKQKYESSQKTIKRQQKELKEREQTELLPTPAPGTPAGGPDVNRAPSSMGVPPPAKPAPPSSAPSGVLPLKPVEPESPKAPAVPGAPANLVDINKSSEADLVLTLGLGKDDSQKLIKNRPYRSKEELLTKAGLPKSSFDRIKDRITITP
jgi:archaellum component FlaC